MRCSSRLVGDGPKRSAVLNSSLSVFSRPGRSTTLAGWEARARNGGFATAALSVRTSSRYRFERIISCTSSLSRLRRMSIATSIDSSSAADGWSLNEFNSR
jgi:hypothetical protein